MKKKREFVAVMPFRRQEAELLLRRCGFSTSEEVVAVCHKHGWLAEPTKAQRIELDWLERLGAESAARDSGPR